MFFRHKMACRSENNGRKGETSALPDYREMYYKLFRAAEQAIDVLVRAQRECEELYLRAPEPGIVELPPRGKETE